MAGVNKVILVGNLGRDPEIRVLESGAKIARFSLATTESYNDRNTGQRVDQTEWHNIILWRGLADIAEKYLRKGNQVYIEGKLQTRSYQDKDGITKYSTEIVCQNMNMLGGRPVSTDTSYEVSNQGTVPPEAPADLPEETDDLPF
jgi:single-strand DNA-binding protein